MDNYIQDFAEKHYKESIMQFIYTRIHFGIVQRFCSYLVVVVVVIVVVIVVVGVKYLKRFGEDKAIQWHCHTVIHEIMHLHSHKGDGANSWITFSEVCGQFDARQKLDEGFTEIFSRTILHRLCSNPQLRVTLGKELPEIVRQGSADFLLPVYEPLKDIACEIARVVGIPAIAEGYFLGNWENFTSKMLIEDKFTKAELWKLVCQVSHTASLFYHQEEAAKKLTSFGVPVSSPKDLHAALVSNTYVDNNIKAVLDFLPI